MYKINKKNVSVVIFMEGGVVQRIVSNKENVIVDIIDFDDLHEKVLAKQMDEKVVKSITKNVESHHPFDAKFYA